MRTFSVSPSRCKTDFRGGSNAYLCDIVRYPKRGREQCVVQWLAAHMVCAPTCLAELEKKKSKTLPSAYAFSDDYVSKF